MKKLILTIVLILVILILCIYSTVKPTLKGFYQSELVNGYCVQILIHEEDNTFVEWINNKEVNKGTYKKPRDNSYEIKGNRKSFEITLNDDNSFDIIINKLNDGKPINMKNITTDDTSIVFEGQFDDVDEYKALLD